MPKFVSIDEAVKLSPDGASIMFGGFMGCGNAHKFIAVSYTHLTLPTT